MPLQCRPGQVTVQNFSVNAAIANVVCATDNDWSPVFRLVHQDAFAVELLGIFCFFILKCFHVDDVALVIPTDNHFFITPMGASLSLGYEIGAFLLLMLCVFKFLYPL